MMTMQSCKNLNLLMLGMNLSMLLRCFQKGMDVILPKKEADPYIEDFSYASKIRQMIRTYYEGVGQSLRVDGKKVQQLIDDHIISSEYL